MLEVGGADTYTQRAIPGSEPSQVLPQTSRARVWDVNSGDRDIPFTFERSNMPKKRVAIPKVDAAKVLFASDRTCCVCRKSEKRVQIHHIDDDPSNNEHSNLAVLCFECHGDTQTTGGFGRQLDAEQVRLYRDDWHRTVAARRVQNYRDTRDKIELEINRIKYATTLVERLRENQDYVTLATIYDDMGNDELRDKYIDLALEGDDSDWLITDLRSMQGRPDLIPDDVVDRHLTRQHDIEDWSNRARTLFGLGRHVEAIHDYVKSVLEDLERGRLFPAAYYLKELFERDLVDRLFELATCKRLSRIMIFGGKFAVCKSWDGTRN